MQPVALYCRGQDQHYFALRLESIEGSTRRKLHGFPRLKVEGLYIVFCRKSEAPLTWIKKAPPLWIMVFQSSGLIAHFLKVRLRFMPIDRVRTLKRVFENGDYLFREIFTNHIGLALRAGEMSSHFLEMMRNHVDLPETRRRDDLKRSIRQMTRWTDPHEITACAGSCNFLQWYF